MNFKKNHHKQVTKLNQTHRETLKSNSNLASRATKKTHKVSGNYDAALLKTYLDSLDSMPRTASVTTSAIFSCV
jgi:RNase P subunit RPR2